jgi:basic membrane protein A
MKKLLAIVLVALMALSLAACTPSGESTAPATTDDAAAAPAADASAAPEATGEATTAELIAASLENPIDTTNVKAAQDAGTLKIGVILVGDENEGYSYAHIEGIEAAKAALGITNEQVIYKYNVPEDEQCYDTAVDLAEQGCTLIFSNSFSHESYMIQAAAEYPDVVFMPATGQQAALCGLPNVGNYFPDVYQSRYVSGVVAGMKLKELLDAGTITDPYVGYVGAYPYGEVVSGYTAFFLGIQSIVPEAHMDVTYTNEWFDITAEAEAANLLISRGAVIISQHADSSGAPSAVEAALAAGTTAYSVGYNVDMLAVAPNAALTSAQNNWAVLYTDIIGAAIKGEAIPVNTDAGYDVDGVQISTLGPSCAPGTAEKVEETIAAIKSGELKVFDTQKWTSGGQHLEAYSNSFGFTGVELIWDGYFHESEVISAPLFDIRIDGITELN